MAPRIHMMSFVIGLLLSLRGVLALIGPSSGGRRCCCDCGGIFLQAHAPFFFLLFCDDADIKKENRTRRDLILRNNGRHCQPAPSYASRIITARRCMSLTSAAVSCSPSSVPLQQQIYNFREGLKQNMGVVVLSLQLLLYFYM